MATNSQTFQPNAPAATEALQTLITALSKPLPDGYMAFLARSNGGEGFIGERYVCLWRAEELMAHNGRYNVAEFFPTFFFIGSDGGGEAYAFDISGEDATVFEVPFIGMPSDARAIADSFDTLLHSLGIKGE
jgi:SMI1/KNR4 family protein SUKH-1